VVKRLEEIGILKDVSISGKKLRVLNFSNQLLLKLLEISEIEKKMKAEPKLSEVLDSLSERLIETFREKFLMMILPKFQTKKELLDRPKIDLLIVAAEQNENSQRIIDEMLMKTEYQNIAATLVSLDDFFWEIKKEFESFKKAWKDMGIIYGEQAFWKEVSKLNEKNIISDEILYSNIT